VKVAVVVIYETAPGVLKWFWGYGNHLQFSSGYPDH